MRARGIVAIAASAGVMLMASACGDRGGEGADCLPGASTNTPSGYCLPRYVTLKRGEVFGRKGPGTDYAPVFTYHARGLPVQIIDETTDWRRICDPDGGSAWVSSAMVDGRRNVMATGTAQVALRASPSDAAPAVAWLRPRALATLGKRKGDWAQVSADGATGWVKSSEVWGLNLAPQCK